MTEATIFDLRTTPFVRRALDRWHAVEDRKRGQIVFIAGRAGSGRSLTLKALARNFEAFAGGDVLHGSFVRGQYKPVTPDAHIKSPTKEVLTILGAIMSWATKITSPGISSVLDLASHLLKVSVPAYELASGFAARQRSLPESPDALKILLRGAARVRPLICLIDDFDVAEGSWWSDVLQSFATEVNVDLPLLIFVTLRGPEDLGVKQNPESDRLYIARRLVERQLAEWWPLEPVDAEQMGRFVGAAEPQVIRNLLDITAGNLRSTCQLWDDWRARRVVIESEHGWRFADDQTPASFALVNDILDDRIKRSLRTEDAQLLESTRQLLSWAALEGNVFTADALAQARGQDRDELIDFLDESLVRTSTQPDGVVVETESIVLAQGQDETRTLWRYAFVSDLYVFVLRRYGLISAERCHASLELARALAAVYVTDEARVAGTLARLFGEGGDEQMARRYQRLADFGMSGDMVRWHVAALQSAPRDDWQKEDYGRATALLLEAGGLMERGHPFAETLAVYETAYDMAVRAGVRIDQASALRRQANVYMQLMNMRSAAEKLTEALQISEEIADVCGAGMAWQGLADIDMSSADSREAARGKSEAWDAAYTKYQTSKALLDSCGAAPLQPGNWIGLAEIDQLRGDYGGAREKLEVSLQLAQRFGDLGAEAKTCLGLASLDRKQDRIEEAKKRYERALQIYQEAGDQAGEAHVWFQMSMFGIDTGATRDFLRNVSKWLEIYTKLRTDLPRLPPSPFE